MKETPQMSPRDKAQLLINSVRAALEHGVKHTSVSGEPLTTILDVLVALKRDGEIRLEYPPCV